MDRELDQFFVDHDVDTIADEMQYKNSAETVTNQFEKKIESTRGKIRFAQDVIALFRFFSDAYVPWQKKAIIVSALLYFIIPLDAIPDFAPFVGYLDDMGVIAGVVKFMASELAPYYPEVEETAETVAPKEEAPHPLNTTMPEHTL